MAYFFREQSAGGKTGRYLHLLLGTVLAVPLFGTDYTFTKIVDNTPGTSPGTFYVPTGPVLINNQGAVVFHAQYMNASRDTVYGIYTGSGNAISTIHEEAGVTSGNAGWATGFNDSGTAVYFKGLGVYTTTAGGTPFLVVGGRGANPGFLPGSGFPTINNSGTVAVAVFNMSVSGTALGTNNIDTRTGSGALQTVVNETEVPRANALYSPLLYGSAINSSGAVAFFATGVAGGSCQCGLFMKSGGTLTMLAQFNGGLASPQINDSGAVAFEGTYQNVKGVFLASGGKVAAVVDLGTQVVALDRQNFSLNNKGQVAYWGKFGISPAVTGIFTGPDSRADRVIATGDALFGSVVSDIGENTYPGRFLNDNGQLVFVYKLANGLTGVAVATPVVSGTPPPTLAANGIVNGASFSGDAGVAPGSIVSLFGANFISQLSVPPGYPLPTSLNGVSVTFNGIPAPLYFVAPAQINAQVPFGVTGSTASVQVRTPAGQSAVQTIKIVPQSPAIFTANQSGVGQAVVVFGNTATIVGRVTAGTDWRPAHAGDTITIYANGLGAVTPAVADGFNSCDKSACAPDLSNMTLRYTTVRPVVQIGNVTVPDSLIQFSGLAPQFVGLYQINLTIPNGITPGDSVPVVIHEGSIVTPANVFIALQ